MSLHRYDAKRDSNEPAIVSALEALGCVVWRVSGKGLPDLIVLRAGKKWLADVKAAKKGVTEPQAELWEEAATKARCSVFILRTPEDAQKMLNNALQPWEPEPWCQNPGCIHRGPCPEESRSRKVLPQGQTYVTPRKGDAAKAPHQLDALAKRLGAGYTPPRSKPVDAAKEAEATFAPKAEPDWHELVDEAVAISKEQCACRLGVLCSYHKKRP